MPTRNRLLHVLARAFGVSPTVALCTFIAGCAGPPAPAPIASAPLPAPRTEDTPSALSPQPSPITGASAVNPDPRLISMTRGGGRGTDRYEMTVWRDGSFRVNAEDPNHEWRLREGSLTPSQMTRLTEAIAVAHFRDLRPAYDQRIMDGAVVRVCLWTEDGSQRVLHNRRRDDPHSPSPPAQLLALEDVVEELTGGREWFAQVHPRP